MVEATPGKLVWPSATEARPAVATRVVRAIFIIGWLIPLVEWKAERGGRLSDDQEESGLEGSFGKKRKN